MLLEVLYRLRPIAKVLGDLNHALAMVKLGVGDWNIVTDLVNVHALELVRLVQLFFLQILHLFLMLLRGSWNDWLLHAFLHWVYWGHLIILTPLGAYALSLVVLRLRGLLPLRLLLLIHQLDDLSRVEYLWLYGVSSLASPYWWLFRTCNVFKLTFFKFFRLNHFGLCVIEEVLCGLRDLFHLFRRLFILFWLRRNFLVDLKACTFFCNTLCGVDVLCITFITDLLLLSPFIEELFLVILAPVYSALTTIDLIVTLFIK